MRAHIAKLLSFVRTTRNDAKVSDVKVDLGGGDVKTAEHFAPPGDDSFPLKTDRPIVTDTQRSGGKAAIGYVDPISTPKALEGDKRIYARDPNTGLSVVEVWLKSNGSAITSNANGSATLRADGGSILTTPNGELDVAANGSISGSNGNGSFELAANGDFIVNGFTIFANGDATGTGSIGAPSVVANGKELTDHTHSGVTTGVSNTGTNN